MSLAAKLRRAPTRLATGAFILNSGVAKLRSTSEEQAKGVHDLATGAYPFLGKVEPKLFLKALGAGETALGAALLLPIFPAGLVGLGLLGFSGSLLTMYARTPSLHDARMRPTAHGVAVAKDIWMAGIGAGLVLDAVLGENRSQEEA